MAKKRKKKTDKSIDPAAVLRIFKQSGRPMRQGDVARALKAPKSAKKELRGMLRGLEQQGKLMRTKRGMYGLPEQMSLVPGKLQIQRSGVGFVLPDDKRRKDIFVGQGQQGDAWHGDRVLVAVSPESGGRRPEGRVVRVLERGRDVLPCLSRKKVGRDLYLCQPTDPRLYFNIMVEAPTDDVRPRQGEVVLVAPGDKLEHRLWAGTALERLGPEDDVTVQEELVKTNHGIPRAFPDDALAEAKRLPPNPSVGPDATDLKGRKDLRDLPLVTIDGAKAKDFDDAVCVRREGRGWRLWVAIADVSHYVPQGSALDREAFARGNSYYFPTSVEPMFPEALSNGLCSLNPDVPRLCMVAEMAFDGRGNPVDETFYPAVMRSHMRLTYARVFRAMQGDETERAAMGDIWPMVAEAEALARAVNAQRMERGSLDFDLPEPEILFNLYGETTDIRPKARNFAHQLIEEFMVAANEAVARLLQAKEAACLYRVHPAPDRDKLAQLFKLIARTELAGDLPALTREGPDVQDLQQLLAAAEDTDLEFLVSRMTLRTMMQAKYQPGNLGHFGLASECYCHFTSPIRRYADLVVHRSLKAVLGAGPPYAPNEKALAKVGGHLSDRERVAMDAEREVLKRLTVLYLRDHVGEVFTGVVSSLADFGFWVELHEVMAEGLVRLSAMDDDYYGFLPERQEIVGQRTGKRYRLGQTVRVKLSDVVLSRQEVNLTLVDQAGSEKKNKQPLRT